MKNYNSDANNKDVITVDYMVTGGRQKDCILRTKNHSVNLTFSFLYPLSPSVMSFITINNLYKSLQTCRSCQKCGVSNRFLTTVCVFIDLDPCIDVTCHYHCLCKAFGPNDARCVAVDSCPSYQEPVCSSNGTTYDNECLFRQEMCIQRLNFSVQHPGSCEG